MKKTILVLAIATITAGTVINGCKSPSEKVEEAQIKVEEADSNLKTALNDSSKTVQRAANVEEWKIFRNESQARIKNNEIRIDALKSKVKRDGMYASYSDEDRIDSLAERNKELVSRMDNYDSGKSDWETFKLEFNRDLDGLGESLKKFMVKNHGK